MQRDPALLLRGNALAEAHQWLERFDRLSDDELEFVEISRMQEQEESLLRRRDTCSHLLESISTSELAALPFIVKQLHTHGDFGQQCLMERLAAEELAEARLRLSFASNSTSLPQTYLDLIADHITNLARKNLEAASVLTARWRSQLFPLLKERVEGEVSDEAMVKICAFLVENDFDSFHHIEGRLAKALIGIPVPLLVHWVDCFWHIRQGLIPPLKAMMRSSNSPQERSSAAFALTKLCEDRPIDLAELACEAPLSDVDAIFTTIKSIKNPRTAFDAYLELGRGKEVLNHWTQRARSVYALLHARDYSCLPLLFSEELSYEGLATLLLISSQRAPVALDIERLLSFAWDDERLLYSAIILCGFWSSNNCHKGQVEPLLNAYSTRPESGVHVALGWLLDRLGVNDRKIKIQLELTEAGKKPYAHGEWLLHPTGNGVSEFTRVRSRLGEGWMCSTAVTKRMFSSFRWNSDISHFNKPEQEEDCPIVGISWYDAEDYCDWLTHNYADGGNRFRLPYRQEWSAAATSGIGTHYWFGDSDEAFPFFGWCYSNSKEAPRPVGLLAPSPCGYFDLHGNVWEWCRDVFLQTGENLSESSNYSPLIEGDSRVLLGGAWCDSPGWCKLNITSNPHWPSDRSPMFGFRLFLAS